MKRTFIVILISALLLAYMGDILTAGNNPSASIEWQETTIDFGEIQHAVPVVAEFRFKNPGMIPLLISDVKPSCGCTVADFPKQPILGGTEGVIRVTFDAKETGYFAKTITVHSNAQGGVTQLYIKGIVTN
jgi:hypothetical protein